MFSLHDAAVPLGHWPTSREVIGGVLIAAASSLQTLSVKCACHRCSSSVSSVLITLVIKFGNHHLHCLFAYSNHEAIYCMCDQAGSIAFLLFSANVMCILLHFICELLTSCMLACVFLKQAAFFGALTQCDMAVCAALGVEKVSEVPVAARVNFKMFQEMSQGGAVRVGGTFRQGSSGEERCLATTDGGIIVITGDAKELSSNFAGFCEVVGMKAGDQELSATAIVPLVGDVDAELWDEAVLMSHCPKLRHLFAPVS